MLKITICTCFTFFSLLSQGQLVAVENVDNYINKNVTVYGKILDAKYWTDSLNQPTFLNMGGRFPNQKLTVVIDGNSRAGFGYRPEEALVNNLIYITGRVELKQGKPSILVNDPFDITFSPPGQSNSNAYQVQNVAVVKPTVAAQQPVKKPESVFIVRNNSSNDAKVKEEEKDRKNKEKDLKEAERQNQVKDAERQRASKEAEDNRQRALKEAEDEKKRELKKTEKVQNANEKEIAVPVNPVKEEVITLKVGGQITLKSNVSLRGGPGGMFNAIGSLKKGTLVKIISTTYEWYKITPLVQAGNTPIEGYVKREKLID